MAESLATGSSLRLESLPARVGDPLTEIPSHAADSANTTDPVAGSKAAASAAIAGVGFLNCTLSSGLAIQILLTTV